MLFLKRSAYLSNICTILTKLDFTTRKFQTLCISTSNRRSHFVGASVWRTRRVSISWCTRWHPARSVLFLSSEIRRSLSASLCLLCLFRKKIIKMRGLITIFSSGEYTVSSGLITRRTNAEWTPCCSLTTVLLIKLRIQISLRSFLFSSFFQILQVRDSPLTWEWLHPSRSDTSQ